MSRVPADKLFLPGPRNPSLHNIIKDRQIINEKEEEEEILQVKQPSWNVHRSPGKV